MSPFEQQVAEALRAAWPKHRMPTYVIPSELWEALAPRVAVAIEAAASAVADAWPDEYAPPAELTFAHKDALTALRGGGDGAP